MKYILMLVISLGLFGCGSDNEIVGNFYDKNVHVFTFKSGGKVDMASEAPANQNISYKRDGHLIKIPHPQLFGPMELVVQDDGSLSFMGTTYVKK